MLPCGAVGGGSAGSVFNFNLSLHTVNELLMMRR